MFQMLSFFLFACEEKDRITCSTYTSIKPSESTNRNIKKNNRGCRPPNKWLLPQWLFQLRGRQTNWVDIQELHEQQNCSNQSREKEEKKHNKSMRSLCKLHIQKQQQQQQQQQRLTMCSAVCSIVGFSVLGTNAA
jgi:hypothetical protein